MRPAAAAGFPPRKPSRRSSSRTSGGTSGGGGDNVSREIAQLEKESNRLQQRALELKKVKEKEFHFRKGGWYRVVRATQRVNDEWTNHDVLAWRVWRRVMFYSKGGRGSLS